MGTTLTGKRVQNTYDSLLKIGDNDNLTGTAKRIGDGLGNDSPIFLSTTKIGIGVTPTYEFQTNSHAKIGGNLIVGGNLTVNGTTTIIDSTVIAIGDNMMEMAKDNVSNTMDIGWYGTINESGEKYVGVFYDASSGVTTPEFHIGLGTVEPSSTASWTTKGKLVIGALDATTGVFSGQVTIPQTPSADTDAASKGYVDSAISSGSVEVAKRIEITVKNISGGSLSKGTIVHASPSVSPPSGNVVEVIAADYDDATKMPGIGVLNETIADEAEGAAVMLGAVSGIDTSSFNAGDELYVGNNGAFTNTKPTANNELIQKIAIVLKVHASNGSIKVFGAGRVNDVPNQISRNVNFTDDSVLSFGNDIDLNIYHASATDISFITRNGTLDIRANDLRLNSFTGESMIRGFSNGDVRLYYDSSEKLTTTSTGISVTGLGQFSNKILVADGSVSAPSYSFTSDTDTGFYLDGASIKLAIGGSNKVTIATSQTTIEETLIVNDYISADDKVIIEGDANPHLEIQDTTNERYTRLYSGDSESVLSYTNPTFSLRTGEFNGTVVFSVDSSRNVTFNNNVLPDVDSANDLGSTSLRWANVWADNINGGTPVNGSGTANDVVMWSDSDTLTDAPIAISGNNATFSGTVTINNNTPLIVNGNDPLISFQNSATNHWQVGLENTNSDRFIFYDNNAAAYQLILESTSGNATFAGDVRVSGGVTRIISNQIQAGYNQNADNTDIWINYQGYQGGTTYFRDFRVGNGKQGQIAHFDGSTSNATFSGSIIVNSTGFTKGGHKISNYFATDAADGEILNLGVTGNIGYIQSLNGTTPNTLTLDGSSVAFRTGSFSTALTLDSSQNATFAGKIFIPQSAGNLQGTGYPGTTYIGSTTNATTTYIQAGSTAKTEIELSGGDVNSNIVFKTPNSSNTTVTAMTIDSSQRVGIGVTSLNSMLTIQGNEIGGQTVTHLHLNSGNNNSYPFLASLNSNVIASGTYGWTFNNSSSTGNLEIGRRNNSTTSDVSLTIARSSGNVGIGGVTSPSTLLHIEGASVGYLQTIKNTTAGGDYLQMLAETGDAVFQFDSGGTGGEATLNMYRDGTQYVKISADAGVNNYFNNGSNLGIGTDTPRSKLNAVTSSGAIITLENDSTALNSGDSLGKLNFYSNDISSSASGVKASINAEVESGFAATSMTFSTAGYLQSSALERMRIDSSGNVGIGVTPESWTVFNPVLRIGDGGALTGTSANNFRMFANTYYDGSYKRIASGVATQYEQDGYHAWYTAASDTADSTISWSEGMRLTSTGLGIGTTSANSILQLSSTGSTELLLSDTNAGSNVKNYGIYTDSGKLHIRRLTDAYSGYTPTITVDQSNVGIGTDSPNAQDPSANNLVVEDTAGNGGITIKTPTNAYGSVHFSDGTGTDAYRGIVTYNHSDNSMQFHTNAAERLRITSGGYTEVKASGGSSRLYLEGANGTHFLTGTSGGDFGIYNDTASSYRMFINSSGNLGIGVTSVPYKFTVEGSTNDNWISRIYNTNTNGAGLLVRTDTTSANDKIALGVYADGGYKMVVRSTGNLGIGQINPVTLKSATTLQVNGNAKLGNANDRGLLSLGDIASTGANAGIWRGAAGAYGSAGNYLNLGGYDGITFTTGNADISSQTERMRLNSTGDILLGGITTVGNTHASFDSASNDRMIFNIGSSTTSSIDIINFRNPNGIVGGINTDGFTTSFSSSSDYRLKENVVKLTNALDKVSELKPSRFNFINEEKTVDGFLAHEVENIVPEAISGTKDQVDDKGNPVYQRIDQSKLIPLLVGAIQELKEEIEMLRSQINS